MFLDIPEITDTAVRNFGSLFTYDPSAPMLFSSGILDSFPRISSDLCPAEAKQTPDDGVCGAFLIIFLL